MLRALREGVYGALVSIKEEDVKGKMEQALKLLQEVAGEDVVYVLAIKTDDYIFVLANASEEDMEEIVEDWKEAKGEAEDEEEAPPN